MTAPATRPRPSIVSTLLALLPLALVLALVPATPAAWRLMPLLGAQSLAMAAACHALGVRVRGGTFLFGMLSHLVLIAGVAAWAYLLLDWPLASLRAAPSLGASLLLSLSALFLLASQWRLWLLPALLLHTPPRSPRQALARSVALSAEPEHLFALLPAGLALLVPVLAALLMSDWVGWAITPLRHWLAGYGLLAFCASLLALRTLHRTTPAAVATPRESTPPARPAVTSIQLSSEDTAPGRREQALLDAARDGDTERALALLAAGADPAASPTDDRRDRRPALLLAAQLGDSRLLRALIARGVDIHAVWNGTTALHAATRDSYHGRPETVTALLTNGADPRRTDAEGNTPLHFAALSIDASVAAMLLDAGADIDALNRSGLSPLAVAGRAGNWSLSEFLLDRGARIDVEHGEPALIAAASSSEDDIIGLKRLLKQRAHVNAVDTMGRTALMTAALLGHAAKVSVLLDAHADVDLLDQRGSTALMDAARAGADDVLAVLATLHPAVTPRDLHGRDALTLACQSPRAGVKTISILLALGADPHTRADDGRSALDHAAAAGRWNLVAALDPTTPLPASHCGDIQPEPGADSPAHLLDALRFGHWAAVSGFHTRVREWSHAERAQLFLGVSGENQRSARHWLLDHDLDAESRLPDGRRLLEAVLEQLPAATDALDDLIHAGASVAGAGLLARAMRHLGQAAIGAALVPRLIAAGADPFGADADGLAPLHYATRHGNLPALDHLLERGADPNTRDAEGQTPLHHALLADNPDHNAVLRRLIRHGADPEAGNAIGETPLGLALANGDTAATNWLRWRGWPLPGRGLRAEDLPAAAACGDDDAVSRLLDLGLTVDGRDHRGATALMRAAGSGFPSIARRLLERGADASASSHNGATALSAAVSGRKLELISLLLDHGAAIDQRLQGGITVLMVAAALGHANVAERLLERGADANARDDKGRGPLHAAAQFCFASTDSLAARRLLDVLLGHGAHADTLDQQGASALLFMLGGHAKPGAKVDATHLGALLPVLLAAGAPLDAADQRGVTALHCCAMHALLQPARLLLARGANRDARDNRERRPADVARLLGFIDVARELGGGAIPGASSTLRQPAE
ncbi:MAG TPA: ankyrin repeat domain-containing protein [Rhodanobacteraceae bacterium]|nr:ankyrin repeat domain-containing protein [Rhodanobacteraceae bacterium]